jgi:hypothetical protein
MLTNGGECTPVHTDRHDVAWQEAYMRQERKDHILSKAAKRSLVIHTETIWSTCHLQLQQDIPLLV